MCKLLPGCVNGPILSCISASYILFSSCTPKHKKQELSHVTSIDTEQKIDLNSENCSNTLELHSNYFMPTSYYYIVMKNVAPLTVSTDCIL